MARQDTIGKMKCPNKNCPSQGMADVRLRKNNGPERNAYIIHEWTRRRDCDGCGARLDLPSETEKTILNYPGFIPLETTEPKTRRPETVPADVPKEPEPAKPEDVAPKANGLARLARVVWDGGGDDAV